MPKKWGVSKETQAKRDRKAASILVNEIREKHKRGEKATKGEIARLKSLTNQNSSHKSPYNWNRFVKSAKSDLSAFNKEMKRQKRENSK
jgi:hypothetical protein